MKLLVFGFAVVAASESNVYFSKLSWWPKPRILTVQDKVKKDKPTKSNTSTLNLFQVRLFAMYLNRGYELHGAVCTRYKKFEVQTKCNR